MYKIKGLQLKTICQVFGASRTPDNDQAVCTLGVKQGVYIEVLGDKRRCLSDHLGRSEGPIDLSTWLSINCVFPRLAHVMASAVSV